jgi:hypothetical protein
MRNARVSRIIATAAIATGGLLGGGGLLLSGATPAGATGGCGTAPVLCMTPSHTITNAQVVKVVVRGLKKGQTIAVTECDANLAGGDPAACDQNPADLGLPGGPMLATAGKKGNARLSYTVLVSSTQPTGDGNCLPGGDTSGVPCFLIAADISTQMPVANPTPFTTA